MQYISIQISVFTPYGRCKLLIYSKLIWSNGLPRAVYVNFLNKSLFGYSQKLEEEMNKIQVRGIDSIA